MNLTVASYPLHHPLRPPAPAFDTHPVDVIRHGPPCGCIVRRMHSACCRVTLLIVLQTNTTLCIMVTPHTGCMNHPGQLSAAETQVVKLWGRMCPDQEKQVHVLERRPSAMALKRRAALDSSSHLQYPDPVCG